MKKIKYILSLENLLSFVIVICPILDILSFGFRNKFNTSYSISTLIRPIIPILVFGHIFIKQRNKDKLKIFIVCLMYILYAVIHLYIYNNIKLNCAYGTVIHEAQYIINYSFMILNLFIFRYIFKGNKNIKLQSSIIIALAIYIISIYISIITKTSSTTYIEGIGYKGWLESGNSVSAILVLCCFIIMSFITKIDNSKIRLITFATVLLVGIYLMLLIGTRVGLIGFILSILCFIVAQIIEKIVAKVQINKKVFKVLLVILILLTLVVILTGSITIKRRNYLKNMQNSVIDISTGEISYLTGDLTNIKNKILNKSIEDNFMTEEQKQSIIELYNIAKKIRLENTNTRMQQLIYHLILIQKQNNFFLILFGNGYLINTNELVLEMEFIAFLLNFGIIGFVLYMSPFITVFVQALMILIKKFKKIDNEFIMLLLTSMLSFMLSAFSGYTFFNSSSMIIIIVANVLLMNKMEQIKVG